ncbi:hypothetical protein IEQ44_05745 [Nocardioides sp. Y6]|uniref:Transmembrane protein n=1 Tax=Nocardioides malaquae TaxID=2773426 RepID=A0ABR9RRF7_9ACTN|nr:hypothetical protein [Nocardioides malaquae]MBE7324148.1 hypothetical protein [Nocardioides malaquae]
MTWDTFGSTAFMVGLPLFAAIGLALSVRGRGAPWTTIVLVAWLVGSGLWALAVAGPPLGTGQAACDATMVEIRTSGAPDCADAARRQFTLATMAYLAVTLLGAQYLARRPRQEDGEPGTPPGVGTAAMRQQFHNK